MGPARSLKAGSRTHRGSGASRAARWLVASSGIVCAGIVALALAVVGAWLLALRQGNPGPGTELITGHLGAVCAAAGLQWLAERRPGAVAGLAAGGVLLVAALVGVVFWWA